MTAPYMRGLLDDGQTPFNPGLPPGLLDMMGQPGKPGANMVQNMQMLGGMSGGRAAGGQQPAPANPIPTPPAPVPPSTSIEAPSMATNNALMYGGMAGMKAAQGGNQGSLGASLGEALAAGTAAFTATKDAEKDKAEALARQDQFARTVRGLGLDAAAREGIIALGPVEGAKLLAQYGIDVAKEQAKPEGATVLGRRLVGNQTGRTIAEAPEDPEKLPEPDANFATVFRAMFPRTKLSEATDGQMRAALDAAEEYRRSGATNVSATASMAPGASSMVNAVGEGTGAAFVENYTQAEAALATIGQIDRALEMNFGNRFSGSGAEVRLQMAKAAGDWLGLPVDRTEIANTETLKSTIQEMILKRMPELDARPTDADVKILRDAIGKINDDPRSLQAVLSAARSVLANRVARVDQERQDYVTDATNQRAFVPTKYRRPLAVPERTRDGATRSVKVGDRTITLTYDDGEWGEVRDGQFYPYRGSLE